MIEPFYLALITFWIYPILAWMLLRITKNKPRGRKILFFSVFSVTFITLTGLSLDIIFRFSAINYILFSLLYLTISLIIWWLCYRKKAWLKVIGCILFFAVFGIGYFMSTVGFVGLGLILGNYIPINEEKMSEKISYKEIYLGNAISDYQGKRIEIYETISFLPFLKKKIVEKKYYTEEIPIFSDLILILNQEKREIYLYPVPNEYNRNLMWSDTIYLNNY